MLLALNGELGEEEEHAAVYYEQLLLYDGEYGEAYGQYGLFLCRLGLTAESRRLWKAYLEMTEKEEMEPMEKELLTDWEQSLQQKEKGEQDEIQEESP